MDMRASRVNDIAIAELAGRFDAYESFQLEKWFKIAVGDVPAQTIINMKGVNFIDSTGLATLVQGMKRCRQLEGDVYLCCLQQPIRVIMELTRLDRVFEIFTSQDEAVERFLNGDKSKFYQSAQDLRL